MEDLQEAGCDIVTLGQYLSPSAYHHPVIEFIHPDTFQMLEDIGYEMGFLRLVPGPWCGVLTMRERCSQS